MTFEMGFCKHCNTPLNTAGMNEQQCPHCGESRSIGMTPLGKATLIFFIVIGLFALTDLVKPNNSREKPEENYASLSTVLCKNQIANMLTSPKSADFPAFLSQYRTSLGNERYAIASYVDAENKYGAVIRANWTCDIQYSGSGDEYDPNNWIIHELDILEK